MTHIFVWTGKNSNRLEKLQAAKVKYTRMNHVKHNRTKFLFPNVLNSISNLSNIFMYQQFASKLKEEKLAEVVNVEDGDEGKMPGSEKKVFEDFLSINKKEVRWI